MASTSSLPIITIIGSLNADLVTYTARLPAGGETLHAHSFRTGSGGKGANQAAACGRLSRRKGDTKNGSAVIKMVGAVGDDGYGEKLLSDLSASGVDVSGVKKTKDESTGVAVIIVEEQSGENRILLSAGANYTLTPAQFKSFDSLGANPSLVILQLEIPLETTVQILETARKEGVPVLLNPAPAVKLPEEAYNGLAHLILNETEAAILSGCKEEELEKVENLRSAADTFHAKGVENVIITLGGRGVFYSQQTKKQEANLLPARKVEVVDTTAAGDTFVGAYSLEVVKSGGDFDLKKALEKANQAAAVTITRKGAQESIPWADEL